MTQNKSSTCKKCHRVCLYCKHFDGKDRCMSHPIERMNCVTGQIESVNALCADKNADGRCEEYMELPGLKILKAVQKADLVEDPRHYEGGYTVKKPGTDIDFYVFRDIMYAILAESDLISHPSYARYFDSNADIEQNEARANLQQATSFIKSINGERYRKILRQLKSVNNG